MPRAKKPASAPTETVTIGDPKDEVLTPPPSVFKPIIIVDGEEHPFVEFERQGETPVLKAVGIAKVSPTSRHWVSFVVTFKGPKVLSVEVSEPDQKLIASDTAKIEFVQMLEADEVF